jgi:TorA maturation chaperone TorD
MAEAMNQGTAVPMGFSGVDEDAEIERADIYGLLARLWLSPPDAELLQQFAVAVTEAPVQGAFLEEPWQALVRVMRETTVDAARAEFEALFHSPGKAEVFAYGSYHLVGALNERPLVALRADIAALNLISSAAEGETEDHVSFVFEVMRYLIAGDDLSICNLEQQRRFFRAHVQTWVGTSLCEGVEASPKAKTYSAIARFCRSFIEVETQGFDMIE